MARLAVKQADSSEVQGAGTWVKYKEPTVSDMQEFQNRLSVVTSRLKDSEISSEEQSALSLESTGLQAEFLSRYIIDWNWTSDESGKVPIDKPENNPDALNALIISELAWLWGLFRPDPDKKKR